MAGLHTSTENTALYTGKQEKAVALEYVYSSGFYFHFQF